MSSRHQREKSVNSSSTELRAFGLIMAAAMFVLAWIFGGYGLVAVGAAFVASALLYPPVLRPLYGPWMRLAEALGWLNTRILLILIFYLVVTPIGLVLRLFRRSPLRVEERNGSFWQAAPEHSWRDKHFEKQF